MRAAWVALVIGCTGAGAGAPRPPAVEPDDGPRASLADEDSYKPSYGKSELQSALSNERSAETAATRALVELEARQLDSGASVASGDQLRAATADLAVRRRFIATLEVCESSGRWCPPRLDEPAWTYDPDGPQPNNPPMTATLRFDVASWRALAAELHGRACACRTLSCVDGVGAAIDQLEGQPPREVLGDDAATMSITRARECLFRLRGKVPIPPKPAAESPGASSALRFRSSRA